MDRYRVEIDGKERQITLSDEGAEVRATVDGRAYALESLAAGRDAFSLRLGTGSFLAHVAGAGAQYRVQLCGRLTRARVLSEREWHLERQAGLGGGKKGQGALRAPMPGKVLKVFVSVGDVVEAGSPLVILEAMKMENELKASGSARVAQVSVAPGTAVEGGAELVRFEPVEGGSP